ILRFSIYSTLPLPHLHSFPTRRSSDLPHGRIDVLVRCVGDASSHVVRRWSHRTDPDFVRRIAAEEREVAERAEEIRFRRVREARSEEHTSELQSRSDLVCRLLLEKKNK